MTHIPPYPDEGPCVRGSRRTIIAAFAGLTLMTVSCGSDATPIGPAASDAAATPSDVPTIALVGTWERENRCQELVSAFTEAGLERWIVEFVAGNGFVPGVRSPDQIADPADPCKGAVARQHSRFFTDDGRFGSLDWNHLDRTFVLLPS